MTGGFTTGPADYLAAERTFLAWIRTGLALMGFGFVVARFGLLLESLQIGQPNLPLPGRGLPVLLRVLSPKLTVDQTRIVRAFTPEPIDCGSTRPQDLSPRSGHPLGQ